MRQQDLEARQLAQEVTDFLEPVILYLFIGSKRADEEVVKKVGIQAWDIKKKLWKNYFQQNTPI